ncbi:hypothetical protein QJS66_15960 [Kocuria rhizophila]|nr:hypothetical protein QJS66_15960 [Kocuria rhizophila]
MPLINAGSAYRSITGPPVPVALRVYVPSRTWTPTTPPASPAPWTLSPAGARVSRVTPASQTSQSLLPRPAKPL